MKPLTADDVTPELLYLRRREFMRGIGAMLASAALNACAGPGQTATPDAPQPTADLTPPAASQATDELGYALTPLDSITGYTNFYEFTTSKTDVARQAQGFSSDPWSVEVGGLVANPRRYTLEDLRAIPQEERIYRMRCVEGWSMVIPWQGFELARILDEVLPTADARYVQFESLADLEQMPGVAGRGFTWPYIEGLRLDEARHPLTILATGLYSKYLLAQNGAPVRLVVPWKYGFKSIKSIIKITLVAEMPITFWMRTGPREYGFYANVNPDVPHPRWSQATERVIGAIGQRETLLFNGYADEVASLYTGMDLRANF
jgi:sulfoxide reductase catalytic subunit YedY